jgi:formylglycine-generating enzyme required for sulfatase activity
MRRLVWWQVSLLFAGAVGALSVTAVLLERRDRIDPSASQHQWGAGVKRERQSDVADDMVLVPGGEYLIGDESADAAGDAPPRRVQLEGFYIDRHEVTNREFRRFVQETGYLTTAEREGGAWIYRGGETDWKYFEGANWQHPLGAGSSNAETMDHPVVLVSWHDAQAYATWAGKRLPTEAEWEVAARGSKAATFPSDSILSTAPVASKDKSSSHFAHAKDASKCGRAPTVASLGRRSRWRCWSIESGRGRKCKCLAGSLAAE